MNCMATLKHIASKNSDYTAIEAYLVYQHDAFTGKQLLDEQGRPKLRESYLLDAQLASEKAKFYEQYKEAKEERLKLQTAKQNVASFFREEEQTRQER